MRAFALLTLLLLPLFAEAAALRLAFEGQVEQCPPELGAILRKGYVFSGTFALGPVQDSEPAEEVGLRHHGVVRDGRFIFDRNHIQVLEVTQDAPRPNWLELVDDDAAHDGRDFAGFLIPLQSAPVGERSWHAAWLELWLFDAQGRMLNSLAVPTEAPRFERGWFRLSFGLESSEETVVVEGPLTVLGTDAGPATVAEENRELRRIIAELDVRLRQGEVAAELLRQQLASTQERWNSAVRLAEFLGQEKQGLLQENARLRELGTEPDPKLAAELAQTKAEHVLALEREAELRQSLAVTEERLNKARLEVFRLLRELSELQLDPPAPDPLDPKAGQVFPTLAPQEVRTYELPVDPEAARIGIVPDRDPMPWASPPPPKMRPRK